MSLINPNPQSKLKNFKSKILPPLLRGMAFILVGISVSCSFPGFSPQFSLNPPPASTYTPAAPTATPQPLPPALAESDPLPGAWLALDNPITLYFNQPMQRSSVEKALSGESALISNISWSDDATLVLSPQEALPTDTEISLSISTDAQAANGQKLTQPIELKYRTASALRLTQSLPEPDCVEVDPASAIVASFNQPVIALGADPNELPVAFTISSNNEDQVAGKGEWLNTSTYIFYPQPALQGGNRYRVALNPQLKSVAVSEVESTRGWSFTTATPKLMSVSPENDSQAVGLDAPIVLKFNQAMNPQSVQAGFQLLDSHQQVVDGSFTWDEAGEVMTYTTSSLLNRSQIYMLILAKEVESLGGAPLDASLESHFQTVPALTVTSSHPQAGHEKPIFEAALLYLSAPIQDEENLDKYISVIPELQDLRVWYSSSDLSISISGSYQPETSYIVILSAETKDSWGGSISSEYKLEFRTSAIPPTINSYPPSEVFLTPQDEGLSLMATNLASVSLTRGSIALADFMTMMGVNGYDLRQSYISPDQQSWQQNLDMPPNLSQWVTLAVSPDRTPLTPGLYFLRLDPGIEGASNTPYILTVSNVHLTFKLSATDLLVWAVDLRNNSPVAGADIQIYDESQNILATGKTDQQGVFQGSVPEIENLYSTFFAVMGKPGDEAFGIALSNWDIGTSGWDFGIDTSFQPPHLESYIYTDRPIYRPGQTVNFRAIIRQAYNGRYSLPDLSASQGQLPITIWDDMGQELSKVNLPVSGFGTAYGEYTLSSEAAPGYYRISCDLTTQNEVIFQVANYRKPEINLQVNFQEMQALAGSSLKADISAQYFFGAPAGNAPLHWVLYAKNNSFILPNYQIGVEDVSWLYAYDYPYYGEMGLGEMLAEGEAKTDPNGNLSLELPTEKSEQRQQLTLEVTITDESGLPVSARGTLTLNPALFYIGIHPDSWIGSANEQIGFDVQTVDWEQKPSGPHSLKAVFQKVNWVKEDKISETGEPVYTAQYTPIASADFKTDSQGMAKLAFTPAEAGTYQLDISGEGAHTSIYIWVVGPEQSVWQDFPNQRIHLVADKDTYEPGDTARVFIPNPFPAAYPALVTVERSVIIKQQISSIEPGGSTLEFPLSNEDAPNIFIAVTLIGTTSEGKPDYRQGYVELQVSAEQQQLNVSVIGQPEKAGPGDEVTFDIQVIDQSEKPVQGEFSMAVVDKAVLTLADPNSEDIFSAYYGSQPLGVRTGLGLAVYAQRHAIQFGGQGGGGGSEATSVTRENFPDTAFWAPDILTDGEGRAQVKVTLPDNLTTWQVDLRGLTKETLVGEAKTEIIASKPLLLRPATPRFFVRGDHVLISTVVQNNTSSELDASVAIQAEGFSLDDPAQATQNVSIPAAGRTSIAWWGTVQDVDSVDMTFIAQGGEYQDSIRVANGAIPVLAYTSPQTFSTSGVLDQAVDRLEVVSIPRSVPQSSRQGELSIELSPSLAGVIGSALDVLEHYPYECTEQTVSRFLPNLETYLAF
ncbi:MAG: Ig-like domain-containing protein, partial [Anaerolineaceae bacterium]